MLERRNSARLPLSAKIREMNGDYIFVWNAADLSEEGIFLSNKSCFSAQDSHSKLSFTLPNGTELHNVTARIIRQTPKGCAYEFLNLHEDQRMALKRLIMARAAS